MERDNFSKDVVKKLAERVNYICSNPDCKKITSGPNANENKSTITGIAAHICGAKDAAKSPRYNKYQSSDERKSIANGIWLCHTCSDIIDKDDTNYTATVLLQWKKTHEEFIKTLQSKGYTTTLELLKANVIEIDLAKQIVNYFDDKRILYDLYEKEIPNYGLRSVLAIRNELTTIKKQLGQQTSLYSRIDQMLKACRKFNSDTNHIDLEYLRYNPKNPDWLTFTITLSELRKILGVHIGELSIQYQIKLSEDLMTIVPTMKE